MSFSKDLVKGIKMILNNELRKPETSGDITIKVEGKSFECDRSVLEKSCDYFGVMFNGKFRESTEDHIVLGDGYVNAIAFHQVLRFAYTGNVLSTQNNVYRILLASEFFKLEHVEKLCTDFIGRNIPILKTWEKLETFEFACYTRKSSLMIVLSQFIMINFFDVLRRHEDYLEQIILDSYLKSRIKIPKYIDHACMVAPLRGEHI